MSSGKELQEMEVGTKQSKTAVNAGAKAADPMPSLQNDGSQLAVLRISAVLPPITTEQMTIQQS